MLSIEFNNSRETACAIILLSLFNVAKTFSRRNISFLSLRTIIVFDICDKKEKLWLCMLYYFEVTAAAPRNEVGQLVFQERL